MFMGFIEYVEILSRGSISVERRSCYDLILDFCNSIYYLSMKENYVNFL